MHESQNVLRSLVLIAILGISPMLISSQSSIMYQNIANADWFTVGFGSYGRIGAGAMPGVGAIEGRRLNLNNMGSIGGRMEEQDYLELGLAFQMQPETFTTDSTLIDVQLRFSAFSGSGSLFANSTTSSISGLTFAIPEMYAGVRNIFTEGLNVWIGARLYRGADVHMADYFYFNDHGGQGFGIEYQKTRFNMNFVSSTDTSSTVPPYFFINIKSGTPSLELRRRTVYKVEHDFIPGTDQLITGLVELHHIGDPSDVGDTSNILLSLPSETGWVVGVKYQFQRFKRLLPGSFNHLAVRYGHGIANGGDGGSTRTWLTFGAANPETERFNKGYSWHIVDHFLLNLSEKFSLNGYFIYNDSKGAADTRDITETYLGREVFNAKRDLTVGVKGVNFITRAFHWQTELHYSQRQDGTQPWYRMAKLSLVPTIVPRGANSVWSRPHLRFIYSLARYNDYAVENRYSSALDLLGNKKWAHYFGVRAEWWTW